MNDLYLYAAINLAICSAIGFIAICRLNSMQGMVLYRVRFEYAAWIGYAMTFGFKPMWGDWPMTADMCSSSFLLVVLLCSGYAWNRQGQDAPPSIAQSDLAQLDSIPEIYR